jgi:hypothetical protein
MVEGVAVEEGWEVQVNFNRAAEAKVVRNSHLYRGRVAAVNEDETFKIHYHDGDEEDSVRWEWVKWRRSLPTDLQASSGEGPKGDGDIEVRATLYEYTVCNV